MRVQKTMPAKHSAKESVVKNTEEREEEEQDKVSERRL